MGDRGPSSVDYEQCISKVAYELAVLAPERRITTARA
jgi:hypothetical protein